MWIIKIIGGIIFIEPPYESYSFQKLLDIPILVPNHTKEIIYLI